MTGAGPPGPGKGFPFPYRHDLEGVLSRFHVILVEPKYSGNLGATARILKNLGFGRVRLVRPRAEVDPEARAYALKGAGILQSAPRFGTLREAAQDLSLIVGTTRWNGPSRPNPLSPYRMANLLRDTVADRPVGIVFGSEDNGLTNEDVALCQWLVTIPTGSEFGSINLSHAVAIVAYEIVRALTEPGPAGALSPASMDALAGRLEAVLRRVGFIHGPDGPRMALKVREILDRTRMDEREASILHGILNEIERALGGPAGGGGKAG